MSSNTALTGQMFRLFPRVLSRTEAEKLKNPLRLFRGRRTNAARSGFLRPTANHHALELADGTPFFVIGDTWYATGTNRFKWFDDDRERPLNWVARSTI